MEFIVRLDNKVNIQVFCFNPVHQGNHMDRVFFEDSTFEAPCPECESTEYLYRKNNVITKKGYFITYEPDGFPWGTNEQKHYGILQINCTEEQAKAWCEGIHNEQAETEAKNYQILADARRTVILGNIRATMPPIETFAENEIFKEAIKEALKSDEQYQTLIWNARQATNRVQIDYRPRKLTFDFEAVLSVDELKNWNDMEEYSNVIEQTTITMKVIN